MNKAIFCTAGHSGALSYARKILSDQGFQFIDRKDPDVTHLLLPVPSFEADGRIKGGGILENVLADLPEDITVIGGNLSHPILQGYHKIDLLQDTMYVAQNAAITADCAIRVAGTHLTTTFRDCPTLVIGWGRIGKCLSTLLKEMGCRITVAVRKESDRCMLAALGFDGILISEIPEYLPQQRLIFNTVPALVLEESQLRRCRPDRILIELASQPGIVGANVIPALGLPGRFAPEASGDLIARTILRYL